MTRRPPVPAELAERDAPERDDPERDEPDDPDALRALLERDDPEALRVLLPPPLFDLPLELPDDRLELPRPPLALIPPLLRFGMVVPRMRDSDCARMWRAVARRADAARRRNAWHLARGAGYLTVHRTSS